MDGNKQPVVSVIIPTYNRKHLLQRALDSVLGQTLKDLEVIITDDGSTDGTAEKFAFVDDPRVQYHALLHRGACAARNAGIELARGQYIAFLDSDDVWVPDKLEVQRRQLEEAGADVVCCAFERHDKETVTRVPSETVCQHRISYQELLGGNYVSTQTLFGKAAYMKQICFDEFFPRMQDWEYAIRLAANCKLVYYPTVLATLYVQSDSISRKPELGLQAMRLLLQKYRREFSFSMPNTLLILSTMEDFASQCDHVCALDYLKAVSIKRSVRDNGILLRKSSSLLLKRFSKLITTRRDTV